MNRWLAIWMAVLIWSPFAWTEEKKPAQDLTSYLDNLQTKLEHIAQRSNQPTSAGSSVVGLRGSKQEPLSKQLYWKGKPEPPAASPEEIKLFRSAIEQAQAGQRAEATAQLRHFLTKYPNGVLSQDAQETLAALAPAKDLESPPATGHALNP